MESESSEKMMSYEEACKIIPRDLYEHITKRMPYVHGKMLRKMLVYLVASHQNGTISLENAPKVIQDFYQVGSGTKAEKDNWRQCSWDDHPGKKQVRELRRQLLKYRDEVMGTRIIITLGEHSEPYRIHIYRREDSRWVSDQGAPEFSYLMDKSRPLTTVDSKPHSEKNDVLQTFYSFADARIFEKIEKCNSSIKLSVTGLAKMGRWKSALTHALRKGACVEMLLSHPECDFVKLRGAAIESNISAMVIENRHTLRDIQQFGKLTARLTSDFISTSYCQIDDLIYCGVFWSRGGSVDGPFFLVHAESDTGMFLARQYAELWESAYADDLSENLPKPNPDDKRFQAVFSPKVKV